MVSGPKIGSQPDTSEAAGYSVGHLVLPDLPQFPSGCRNRQSRGRPEPIGRAARQRTRVSSSLSRKFKSSACCSEITTSVPSGKQAAASSAKRGEQTTKNRLNAIRQTLHNGPLHDWAVQYGFQHQRFVTCRNRVILFQNKHSTTRVIHGKSLLSVRPHSDGILSLSLYQTFREIHPFPEKVQGNFLQIFRPFLFEFIKDTGNSAN